MITERKALLELKTILIKTMDERGGSGLNDALIVLNDLILAIEIDATNHRLKTYQDNLAYIEHRIKVELKILEELK